MASPMGRAAASFLIPPLTAAVLLYQVLANLQIGFTRSETLVVIGVVLGGAAAAGVLAAVGGAWARVTVFMVCVLLLLDVAFGLPDVFMGLQPEQRAARARNARRIDDVDRLQAKLESYKRTVGVLPGPSQYGEGIGPAGFWEGWWDLSTHDGNGDGRYFLDFLIESGIARSVPVDPLNETPAPEDPRRGFQYVYYLVPAGYDYEGGLCDAAGGRSMYLLAATRLEAEVGKPPRRFAAAECDCLWRDRPGFFQPLFDYVLCGTSEP